MSFRKFLPRRTNPMLALFLCGCIGAALGLSHATWQASVETGQVLAGIVQYPSGNPNYLYHLKVFSIVNHLSAQLLLIFNSERTVSIIISGLLGMVSFQALGMVVFVFAQDAFIACASAIIVYFANSIGVGVIYPIMLLGFVHTFGMLGLSYIVLVCALLGSNCYRSGLFLLGLAPAIHPSLSLWLFCITFIGMITQWKQFFATHKKKFIFFAVGVFVTGSFAAYQIMRMKHFPQFGSGGKNIYFVNFIRYWDFHRVPMYVDQAHHSIIILKKGIIYSACCSLLAFLYLVITDRTKQAKTFFLIVVITAGILAPLLGIITHFPVETLPPFLLGIMPGRYINFSNLVLFPMTLGILFSHEMRKQFLMSLFIIFLLLLFSTHKFHAIALTPLFVFFVLVMYIALRIPRIRFWWLALKNQLHGIHMIDRIFYLYRKNYGRLYIASLCIFCCCVPAFFLLPNDVYQSISRVDPFIDRTNSKFFSAISHDKGLMAITGDFYLFSLKTRRPIILDAAGFDGFTYVPETGPETNRILTGVYGLDLLIPLDSLYWRKGCIPQDAHRQLWQARTVDDWRKVRREFGITGIVTPSTWSINLPCAAKDQLASYYVIPQNEQE